MTIDTLKGGDHLDLLMGTDNNDSWDNDSRRTKIMTRGIMTRVALNFKLEKNPGCGVGQFSSAACRSPRETEVSTCMFNFLISTC